MVDFAKKLEDRRMATTVQQPTQPSGIITMKDITKKGANLPNRYMIHALEGWGKTSLAAQLKDVIFVQSRGETGLDTLIDAGRLPDTAHFPMATSWTQQRSMVQSLIREPHDYKALAVDTINGAERLCHEHICATQYKGDWANFQAFHAGYKVAMAEWTMFLNDLDTLRAQRKMIIFLLCHTSVKKFKNPEGSDYDRYQPDMHPDTWGLTHKWTDVVMFGNFITATEKDAQTKRAKGIGGTNRILYCTRDAAWDAKNRIGLPPEIVMGDTPQEAYGNLVAAIKAGRGIAASITTGATE